MRLRLLPVVDRVFVLIAGGAVTLLEEHVDRSRPAQLRLASMTPASSDLQAAPFRARAQAGGFADGSPPTSGLPRRREPDRT